MEACLLANDCVHGPAASNPHMEPMLAELLKKRGSVTRLHHSRLVRTSMSADIRICRSAGIRADRFRGEIRECACCPECVATALVREDLLCPIRCRDGPSTRRHSSHRDL
jgi:hypothetical protein